MTAPNSEYSRIDGAVVPPPGCPAHISSTGPGGVTRVYGPGAQKDPMGLYEQLRSQHGPVAPVLLEGDVPAWLVLGYRENMDVARRFTQFSRDSRIWHGWQRGLVPSDSPLMPFIGWRPDCASADGEEHEHLRGAVTDSMGRFDQRGIRRYVTRFSHQLIDGFSNDGHAELVSQFTEHLPMLVVTEMLGIPEGRGQRLVAAARDLLKGSETVMVSNEYILETIRQLVENKRDTPGEDLASWILTHHSDLTTEEVQHHLRLVLIAAYEMTTNLMTNTLRMVLTDHRFRASLSGGHMTLPDAVEQVLWDEPPLMVCPGRWATGDTQLGGQDIRAGDMLLLGLAAGNVDPAVRPDINTPMHGNRAHMAFSGGPHECPGQDIGRAITDTGIDTLLLRLPDLRLSVPEEELTWSSSTWVRHLTALPVEFGPRRPRPAEPEVPRQSAAPMTETVEPPAPATTDDTAGQSSAPGSHPSPWVFVKRWFRRR